MEKFRLQPGEIVLKKAGMIYFPPETKNMGAFKAAFSSKNCVGFLTSTRLAGCTKLVEFPWGVLVWLIRAMLGRKVIFEVPLASIKRLEVSEKNMQFLVTSADGSEQMMTFDSFFDSRAKWMAAIADAIAAADPSAKVNRAEKTVEIERA